MSHKGKTQLTIVFTAPPDLVAEGDRIFASHAKWMRNTHSREGAKALLHYNVVKGPELSNPMDPSSKPTGNTSFVLTEVYETPAGVADLISGPSYCVAQLLDSLLPVPAETTWSSSLPGNRVSPFEARPELVRVSGSPR